MIMKFSINNEAEMHEWDSYVNSHPQGTPFHLSNWIKIIKETYSFKPVLYVHKNEGGEITGIFPCFLIQSLFRGTRVVSLPFSDYGGSLASHPYQEKHLLDRVIEENKDRANYIEIRRPISGISGIVYHNYYKRFILELLSDPQMLMRQVEKRTIQYSLKKAKKSGIEIKEENTQLGMDEFQRLNKLTRKKHGVPSQPDTYFKNLFEHMVVSGNASILLAIYENRAIAAGLFFNLGETIYYKYNASDPKYLSKTTPNHLLTWYAIEKACLNGHKFFDFGRTSPDNAGLMRYKGMWGAKSVDFPYSYYPKIGGATAKEGDQLLYRLFTHLWQRLPETWTDFFGPMLYKYTG